MQRYVLAIGYKHAYIFSYNKDIFYEIYEKEKMFLAKKPYGTYVTIVKVFVFWTKENLYNSFIFCMI